MKLGLSLSMPSVAGRGGSTPFDPASLEPVVWWDAQAAGSLLDGSGNPSTDGGVIATWTDVAGAFDATQGTDAARPLVDADGINGHRAAAFNGARTLTHTYAKATNPAITVFMVASIATGTTGYKALLTTVGANFNNLYLLARLDTPSNWGCYSMLDINEPADTDIQGDGMVTLCVTRTAAGNGPGSFFLNGAADGTLLSSSGTATGYLGGNVGASQGFTGLIGECMIVDREVTASERGLMMRYLARKWAVAMEGELFAFGGDSVMQPGSPTSAVASCPTNWMRAYGSQWDYVADGSSLAFSTGGVTAEEWADAHLADMVASAARICALRLGSNDAIRGGITAAETADEITAIIGALKAAGKAVVILAVPPIPLDVEGNEEGAYSANVVEWNTAIRAATLAAGGFHINEISAIELTVGTGIGDPQYFPAANLHPGNRGAQVLGKAEAARFASLIDLTGTPLANTDWITPNADYASVSSGRPASYGPDFSASVTLANESVFTDDDGTWWRMDCVQAGASYVLLRNIAAMAESPAGKTVDCIIRFRVTAGALEEVAMSAQDQDSNTLVGEMAFSSGEASRITSEDGIITLRSRPFVVAGDDTRVSPWFIGYPATGGCTLEIAEFTIREIA